MSRQGRCATNKEHTFSDAAEMVRRQEDEMRRAAVRLVAGLNLMTGFYLLALHIQGVEANGEPDAAFLSDETAGEPSFFVAETKREPPVIGGEPRRETPYFGGETFGGDTAGRVSLIVDDFEGSEVKNRLGNRANVFIRAPSRAMVSRQVETIGWLRTNVLMLRYDKKNTGGPFDSGGWCGYYTLLKSPPVLVAPTQEQPNPPPMEEQYLDGADYQAVTFWVRGARGDENFVVGLADRYWDKVGDSVKSQEIAQYLPAKKLTTDWQKATIPLEEFFVDHSQLASIAIVFEGDLFPETGHAGTVYIDNVALE